MVQRGCGGGAVARRYDIPIIFDNVSRVMVLGEMCYGIGRRHRNFICVNVGYGSGADIIVDGKLLLGPVGMAGEFGHITLDKDSKIQCDCGNYGCLEALASGNAIAKVVRVELGGVQTNALTGMCGGDLNKITAEIVAAAAKLGDTYAWGLFTLAAEYLGVGITGLINLFSPEAVVIGGGVVKAGDILFDNVRKIVSTRALNKITRDVTIMPATFGMEAAVMGAVALILNKLLNCNLIEEDSVSRS